VTPEERIALAEAMVGALNAQDLERYFALTDPEFEIRTDPSWPGGAVTVRRDATRRFYEQLFEDWDELRYERVEVPVAIGERVLARDRWVGLRAGSEPSTLGLYYAVTSFRGGRAATIHTFTDRTAALEFARSGTPEP
jgi:ketosteroid isomerase-like protein